MYYRKTPLHHILESDSLSIIINKETYWVENLDVTFLSHTTEARIQYDTQGRPILLEEKGKKHNGSITTYFKQEVVWGQGDEIIKFEDNLGNYYEKGAFLSVNPFPVKIAFVTHVHDVVLSHFDGLYVFNLKQHTDQESLENLYENIKLNTRTARVRWGNDFKR